jgi:hypothetical protein
MTRLCSWCGKRIGERCAKCASANVEKFPSLIPNQPPRCQCRACNHTFDAGEGGVTHGMCDECRSTDEASRPPRFISPKRWEQLGDQWITWLAGDAKAISTRSGITVAEAIEALTRLAESPGFALRLGNAAQAPQKASSR